MKKKLMLVILLVMSFTLTGCGNKYKGYWCKYNESSSIVVLLNKNVTEKQRETIEAKIETFENVQSSNYYSREDYAAEIGEDVDNMDIFSSYFILFDSMDYIGTYIEELEKIEGVKSVEQSNARSNISLYNIKSWGKYTYTDSDEAVENDIESGTYNIKKGVITFSPKDKEKKGHLLYIKNGLLCGNADCSEIYARSTSTCSPITEDNE